MDPLLDQGLEFGSSIIFPLLFWAPLFFLLTLVAELFVVRWARRTLRAAGRATGKPTIVLVLVLCVALPAFAGYSAAAWSFQRSVDRVLSEGSSRVVELAIDQGTVNARLRLGVTDVDAPLDLGEARAVAARVRAEGGARRLAGLVGRAYWAAIDEVLRDAAEDQLTWRKVETLATTLMRTHGKRFLGGLSGGFRSGAQQTLLLLGVVLALVNAGVIYGTRRLAQSKLPA